MYQRRSSALFLVNRAEKSRKKKKNKSHENMSKIFIIIFIIIFFFFFFFPFGWRSEGHKTESVWDEEREEEKE